MAKQATLAMESDTKVDSATVSQLSLMKSDSQLVTKMPNLNSQVKSFANAVESWNDKKDSFTNQKQTLERDITRAKQDLSDQQMRWNSEKVNLNGQISSLTSQLSNARGETGVASSQVNSLMSELGSLRSELSKEKGWWDKWINSSYQHQDKYSPIIAYASSLINVEQYIFWQIGYSRLRIGNSADEISEEIVWSGDKFMDNNKHKNRDRETAKKSRKLVKCLYKYWRERERER